MRNLTVMGAVYNGVGKVPFGVITPVSVFFGSKELYDLSAAAWPHEARTSGVPRLQLRVNSRLYGSYPPWRFIAWEETDHRRSVAQFAAVSDGAAGHFYITYNHGRGTGGDALRVAASAEGSGTRCGSPRHLSGRFHASCGLKRSHPVSTRDQVCARNRETT